MMRVRAICPGSADASVDLTIALVDAAVIITPDH